MKRILFIFSLNSFFRFLFLTLWSMVWTIGYRETTSWIFWGLMHIWGLPLWQYNTLRGGHKNLLTIGIHWKFSDHTQRSWRKIHWVSWGLESRNTDQKSAATDKEKHDQVAKGVLKKQGCHSLSRDHWEDHDTYIEKHSRGLWGTDRMIWRVHSLHTWSISLECMMIGVVTISTYTAHFEGQHTRMHGDEWMHNPPLIHRFPHKSTPLWETCCYWRSSRILETVSTHGKKVVVHAWTLLYA